MAGEYVGFGFVEHYSSSHRYYQIAAKSSLKLDFMFSFFSKKKKKKKQTNHVNIQIFDKIKKSKKAQIYYVIFNYFSNATLFYINKHEGTLHINMVYFFLKNS